MLETSKDVLNITLAISVLLFSMFSCWAIYYFAMFLRQLFKIIKEVKSLLFNLEELIKTIKDKILSSTSHLILITQGIKKITEFLQTKK